MGAPGSPTAVLAHLTADVHHVVGSKVGEAPEFQIGPDLLLRVQFGGIRGQPFDLPLRMTLQVVAHLLVSVGFAAIPQEQQGASQVAAQMTEKPQNVGASDILLGVQSPKRLTRRRRGETTKARVHTLMNIDDGDDPKIRR